MTPVGWDDANNTNVKFRFESYVQGKEYVEQVTLDVKWMSKYLMISG